MSVAVWEPTLCTQNVRCEVVPVWPKSAGNVSRPHWSQSWICRRAVEIDVATTWRVAAMVELLPSR
jgi:hypothetical protein